MSDPTFTKRFGLAVQEDILRQAATDRQRRQARSQRRDGSPTWLMGATWRLVAMFRSRSSRREPMQSDTTTPRRSWSLPTDLPDDY